MHEGIDGAGRKRVHGAIGDHQTIGCHRYHRRFIESLPGAPVPVTEPVVSVHRHVGRAQEQFGDIGFDMDRVGRQWDGRIERQVIDGHLGTKGSRDEDIVEAHASADACRIVTIDAEEMILRIVDGVLEVLELVVGDRRDAGNGDPLLGGRLRRGRHLEQDVGGRRCIPAPIPKTDIPETITEIA